MTLLSGDDSLSEEFKTKVTVFDAAIKSKVKEIAEEMQADYDKKLTEETSKSKDELVEKVDSYLAYVVEEWMKENELALERGIKAKSLRTLLVVLKKLFEDHYIDVPDEKYNVLEDQSSKIEELEKKLNESIEKNVELSKENSEHKRQNIIDECLKICLKLKKKNLTNLLKKLTIKTQKILLLKLRQLKSLILVRKNQLVR